MGRELRFSDEEIVAALAGLMAECDGHNYGNAGESSRVTDQAVKDMLRRSLPLADTYIDPKDGLEKPYIGKDWASLGIYQQIPTGIYSWGWGTVEELMNPEIAARKFFAAFRNTVQLPGEPMYFRVQKTQQSQFDGITLNPATGKPYPFADNYRVRMTTARNLLASPTYFTDGGKSVIDP